MKAIHFDQEVQVCEILKVVPNSKYFCTPLIMTFSLFDNCLRSMGYLSFFNTLEPSCVSFFFFFSFAILRASCVSFFSIGPYFFLTCENFREKDSWQMNGVFILGEQKTCFCITLSVRVTFYLWVFVNLDHGCMTRISIRVTKIWQNSMWI